jgi:ABC-type transport system involved in cytochrome bd biosynthesis fused ATPase/permease subunit
MNRRVVVTGMGALTPIGNTLNEYWEALKAGKSGAALITKFDTEKFKAKFACELKGFNSLDHFDSKEVRKYDLFSQFALVAVDEAVKHAEINFEDLRKQIGFVTQDTQLFSGTIKENLLFVNPKATEEELQIALDKASCQSLLKRADNGINTVIGEGGLKLSGGEKQRISIARALLRNPRVLLFDEATSALDSITEEEITETIRSISARKEQITVLIAHRLSTIMHADTIYVLERGEIVETGSHQELLDAKGLYYAMWRQQIGERKKD